MMALGVAAGVMTTSAQQVVNDNNTPLHLMKPAYKVGYGRGERKADNGPCAELY